MATIADALANCPPSSASRRSSKPQRQRYRQILQLKLPDFARSLQRSGQHVTCSKEKLGQAVASFLRALELNPNLPGACKLLGYSLADQGHFDLATH